MSLIITQEMMTTGQALRNLKQSGYSSVQQVQKSQEMEHAEEYAPAVTAAERAMKQIEEARAGVWQSISKFQQRALEGLERIRHAMEIINRVRRQVQIARTGGHAVRRNQDGSSGKGRKSSSKGSTKSASGGGNGGGDGGSDGDGPARASSKSKKSRSKPHSSSLQHPPSSSSGTTANTPPPYSSSSSPPGQSLLVTLVIIYSIIVVILFALDKDKTALAFAGLMGTAIPALMRCVIKPPK